MKYILDFDRTLFDTSLLKKTANDAGIKQHVSPDTLDIFPAKDFLYEDTLGFLKRRNKEDMCILTAFSHEEYQRAKIKTSGLEEYVSNVIYLDGLKGPYVKELYKGEKTVFLDDKASQVESVKETCPSVICIQVIRKDPLKHTEETKHPDIHIARDLAEVDDIIKFDK